MKSVGEFDWSVGQPLFQTDVVSGCVSLFVVCGSFVERRENVKIVINLSALSKTGDDGGQDTVGIVRRRNQDHLY